VALMGGECYHDPLLARSAASAAAYEAAVEECVKAKARGEGRGGAQVGVDAGVDFSDCIVAKSVNEEEAYCHEAKLISDYLNAICQEQGGDAAATRAICGPKFR